MTKITTEKVRNDSTTHEEIITKKETDEKLIEKFKPEETIQYEYHQVIEQPDSTPSAPTSSPSFDFNKDKTQIENTTKKTTTQKTNEKFEQVESLPAQNKIKTITTDMTTFITEEEEDQLIEIIEKTKDTQEFSYQHLGSKQPAKHIASDLEESTNLVSLSEKLNSSVEHEKVG